MMRKKIKWMTELPSRCNHPRECLVFREGLMGDYVECTRCGEALSREWVRAREKREVPHEIHGDQTILLGTY